MTIFLEDAPPPQNRSVTSQSGLLYRKAGHKFTAWSKFVQSAPANILNFYCLKLYAVALPVVAFFASGNMMAILRISFLGEETRARPKHPSKTTSTEHENSHRRRKCARKWIQLIWNSCKEQSILIFCVSRFSFAVENCLPKVRFIVFKWASTRSIKAQNECFHFLCAIYWAILCLNVYCCWCSCAPVDEGDAWAERQRAELANYFFIRFGNAVLVQGHPLPTCSKTINFAFEITKAFARISSHSFLLSLQIIDRRIESSIHNRHPTDTGDMLARPKLAVHSFSESKLSIHSNALPKQTLEYKNQFVSSTFSNILWILMFEHWLAKCVGAMSAFHRKDESIQQTSKC